MFYYMLTFLYYIWKMPYYICLWFITFVRSFITIGRSFNTSGLSAIKAIIYSWLKCYFLWHLSCCMFSITVLLLKILNSLFILMISVISMKMKRMLILLLQCFFVWNANDCYFLLQCYFLDTPARQPVRTP